MSNRRQKPSILTSQPKPQQYLIGGLSQITAGGRQSKGRIARHAGMKAAASLLPWRAVPDARRPCGEHPTAGPKMIKKRERRAPEVGSVLPRRPNVLRIPARDGGGGI